MLLPEKDLMGNRIPILYKCLILEFSIARHRGDPGDKGDKSWVIKTK